MPPSRVIQGFFPAGRLRIDASLAGTLPRTAGQPLPPVVQRRMEQAFGTDFSAVRVHVGPEAASIGALAFTQGTDVYFAPGQYNPHHPHGQRLIAHELTHVVQQLAGRVRSPFGTGLSVIQDPHLEAEAERMSLRLSAVPSPQPTFARPPAAPAVQRRQGMVLPRPVAPHVRAALAGTAVQRQVRPGGRLPFPGVVQCFLSEKRKIELKLIAKEKKNVEEAGLWLSTLNNEEQAFVNQYYKILISQEFWPVPEDLLVKDENLTSNISNVNVSNLNVQSGYSENELYNALYDAVSAANEAIDKYLLENYKTDMTQNGICSQKIEVSDPSTGKTESGEASKVAGTLKHNAVTQRLGKYLIYKPGGVNLLLDKPFSCSYKSVKLAYNGSPPDVVFYTGPQPQVNKELVDTEFMIVRIVELKFPCPSNTKKKGKWAAERSQKARYVQLGKPWGVTPELLSP